MPRRGIGNISADGSDASSASSKTVPGWRTWTAWTLFVVTMTAVVVTAVALVASGLSWRTLFPTYALTNAWMAAAFAPFGAIVALRRPELVIGWLFSAYALLYGLSAACLAIGLERYASDRSTSWSSAVGWTGTSLWTPAIAFCLPMVVLVFPDGRLPSRRWRALVWLCVANTVVWPIAWALDPRQVPVNFFVTEPPVRLTGTAGDIANTIDSVSNAVVSVTTVLALVALVLRWRRSSGRERAQLSWLVWGIVVAVVLFAPTAANVQSIWSTMMLVGIVVLPASAVVALLRHQLLDIDLVINRTVVYVVLTGALVGVHLLVVQLVAAIVGDGLGSTLTGAAVVAVAFSPFYRWLQARVGVLLYGLRSDPTRALSSVTTSLEGGGDDGLELAIDAIRESLRLPHVVLDVDGRRIGAANDRDEAAGEVILRYGGKESGRLTYWTRRGQASLSRADHAALALVAAPLAAAVNAVAMSTDLSRSQQRLVTARAEERQRLRRDLHDGLGPALTAVALKADAASNLVTRDAGEARELIAQLAAEARSAIGEVRRIAHDLRPGALENTDLATALVREAQRFSQRVDGEALEVTVTLPPVLPTIDPATEAAAFRIATEALTNVARHSDARSVVVRLALVDDVHGRPGTLQIEVRDDGSMANAASPESHHSRWNEGFGLTSMRRRVADLGGTLDVGPTSDGGRVAATFPLPGASLSDTSLSDASLPGASPSGASPSGAP